MKMREIKFRAWDKKRKQFIEILLLHYKDDGIFAVTGSWNNKSDTIYFIEDLDLSEYTGLKDKNGKEIYEGDIVYSKFRLPGEHQYIVKWVEKSAEFSIQDKDVCEEYVEIIGNAYENPELLENMVGKV